MNIDEALTAHINFKLTLGRMVENAGVGMIQNSEIYNDHLCELGRSLFDNDGVYASLPQYDELLKMHAAFHACAAEVIRKVEANDVVGAHALLQGALTVASKNVVAVIVKFKNSEVNE